MQSYAPPRKRQWPVLEEARTPPKTKTTRRTHTHTHTTRAATTTWVETRTIFFSTTKGAPLNHPSYRLPDIWEEEKQDLKQTLHQPTRPPMNAKAAIRPPADGTRTDNKGCKPVAHSHSPNRQRPHLTTPPRVVSEAELMTCIHQSSQGSRSLLHLRPDTKLSRCTV